MNWRARSHKALVVIAALIIAPVLMGIPLGPSVSQAQDVPNLNACDDVRLLMMQPDGPLPNQRYLGGGEIAPGAPVTGNISAGEDLGDLWSFAFMRPAASQGQPGVLSLQFSGLTPGLELEFAVFRGMTRVTAEDGTMGYRLILPGTEYRYPLTADGAYTVVVQRQRIAATEQTGEYTLAVDFPPGGSLADYNPALRDDSTSLDQEAPPRLESGRALVSLPSASFVTHPGAVSGVLSRGGTEAQVLFRAPGGNASLRVGSWASQISLVGGSLGINGVTPDERPRILYIESLNLFYRHDDVNMNTIFNAVTQQPLLRIDSWEDIAGVWMLDECVGVLMHNGNRFVAPLVFEAGAEIRDVRISGGLEHFAVDLRTLTAIGSPAAHTVDFSWESILPDSEVLLADGVLNATLRGGQSLRLQDTAIDLLPAAETYGNPAALDITLSGQANPPITMALDWTNLGGLSWVENTLTFNFTDAPRGVTTRPGANLLRLTARQDVVHIVYRATENGPGEERLLLPARDSYVELVTPGQAPAFDGHSLPGAPDYGPRALNNLGGECYPVNTMLPEANCPPNGYANPANGNLWYAVTDHQAAGYLIDLALTRSYNSLAADVTGPFGHGWTTAFLLDYDVSFDPAASARVVQLHGDAVTTAYRAGLDPTWVPHGLVTFTTPSGSRHTFMPDPIAGFDTATQTGTLRAITMPNWTLHHGGIFDETWQLQQADGLRYDFDRAGRLLRYGYPDADRMIEIQYPDDRPRHQNLDGPGDLSTAAPVVISDDTSQRRLELYFDPGGHIIRSILRDMTQADDLAVCDTTQGCYEIQYEYDEQDRLRFVTYSNGQVAEYRYNPAGRLEWHNDPRAPIAPIMRYEYDRQQSAVTAIYILSHTDDSAGLFWRDYMLLIQDDNQRLVEVTDEHLGHWTYTYALETGEIDRAGSTYTLAQAVGPLALGTRANDPFGNAFDADPRLAFEQVPLTYQWQNGLLVQADAVRLASSSRQGRNYVQYEYTATTGELAGIVGGYQPFGITFDIEQTLPSAAYQPEVLDFGDRATQPMQFTYDETTGWVHTMQDRDGARYVYTWDTAHNRRWLTGVTRENDGLRWVYTHNVLGLVETATRYLPADHEESAAPPYQVTYTWDGLGRLIGIDDPLLGHYSLTYRVQPVDENGQSFNEILITDEAGTLTVTRFDAQGRLIETRLQQTPGSEDFLRRRTYHYDNPLGRLTEIRDWLTPLPEPAGTDSFLATRYVYEDVLTLPAVGDDRDELPIIGYRISIIDPAGRTRHFTYDALDRIRETMDETGLITRYDYAYLATLPEYWVRVVQREVRTGTVLTTTTYDFNEDWQLRQVARGDAVWTFNVYVDNTRLAQLVGLAYERGSGSATMPDFNLTPWTYDEFGRAVGVTLNQLGDALADPVLNVAYDFMGRLAMFDDGVNGVTQVVHCPGVAGGDIVWRSRPLSEDEVSLGLFSCQSADLVATALHYDAAGRLVRIQDEYGIRTFAYERTITESGEPRWAVTMTAYPLPDSGSEGAMPLDEAARLTWRMEYDVTGNLVRWVNEVGVVRQYTYDRLGQLLAVTVPEQPEDSFTFTYNAANLLTSIQDGLGRGYRYSYDAVGNVVMQQDSQADHATTFFVYDQDQRLVNMISPLGATTTYQYEGEQLILLTDPAGSVHRFTWDEAASTLYYQGPNDPAGQGTRYTFDNLGLLVSILDSANRLHTITYDNAGQLTTWTQPVVDPALPSQQWTVNAVGDGQFTLGEANTPDWGWQLAFTPGGNLAWVANAADVGITFRYDPLGRLTAADVDGRGTWQLARESSSPLIQYSDPFGQAFHLTYDPLYRLLRVSDAREATDYFTYDYQYPCGDQPPGSTTCTDPTVNLLITESDGASSITRTLTFFPSTSTAPQQVVLRAPGQRVVYTYNAEDLLETIAEETCMSSAELPLDVLAAESTFGVDYPGVCQAPAADAEAGSTPATIMRAGVRFVYDVLGRPISYVDSTGNIQTFTYDNAGNLLVYRDRNGQTYSYDYDVLNRLIALDGPTGTRLLLTYDERLDLVNGLCLSRVEDDLTYQDCTNAAINEFGGILETYAYDTLGRLAAQSFPNLGADGDTGMTTVTYDYDPTGTGLLHGWWITDNGVPVILAYDADVLGLLNTVIAGNQRTSIHYDAPERLASTSDAGDLIVTRDALGRVESLSVGGHTLTYTYIVGGGYRITTDSGAWLDFELNPHGLLAAVDYGTTESPGETPEVTIDYQQADNLTLSLRWRDEGRTILTLNPHGQPLSVAHRVGNSRLLSINYLLNAEGQVQQQQLVAGRSGERYLIVTGYDGSGRPLTIRVSTDNQLLSVLTFTYNKAGQRVSEVHQYADGSQILITDEYNQIHNQLQYRQIEVSGQAHALPETSQILSYRFRFDYDAAGNLSTITPVPAAGEAANAAASTPQNACASYTYDAVNRLVRAEQRASITQAAAETTAYRYDIYHRLTQLGSTRLIYQGDSGLPVVAYTGDEPTLYAQLAQGPAFFSASGETLTWLLHDGRSEVRAVLPDDPTSFSHGDLHVLDPLGRQLVFEPPVLTEDDPCAALWLLRSHGVQQAPQLVFDGMIWDSQTGLYFIDGRAYAAETGRFLQRNPQGADALGNIYAYTPEPALPPIRQQMPPYLQGLSILQEARANASLTQTLTADAIRARFIPIPIGSMAAHPLAVQLSAARAHTALYMGHLLTLPQQLASNYNLSTILWDSVTGALSLTPAIAPGQRDTATTSLWSDPTRWPENVWTPAGITAPDGAIAHLLAQATPPEPGITTYLPQQWQPQLPLLADIWQPVAPALDMAQMPGAAWDLLPHALDNPTAAIPTLDLLSTLTEMPSRTGTDWLSEMVRRALPTLPDVPPATGEAWLTHWFSFDTLGVAALSDFRWPVPAMGETTLFRLGDNTSWRMPDSLEMLYR